MKGEGSGPLYSPKEMQSLCPKLRLIAKRGREPWHVELHHDESKNEYWEKGPFGHNELIGFRRVDISTPEEWTTRGYGELDFLVSRHGVELVATIANDESLRRFLAELKDWGQVHQSARIEAEARKFNEATCTTHYNDLVDTAAALWAIANDDAAKAALPKKLRDDLVAALEYFKQIFHAMLREGK